MPDVIKINDSTLDKASVQKLIQSRIADMPDIPDLSQTGPKKLHAVPQKPPDPAAEDAPAFSYTVMDLIENTAIREPEFESEAPIIGPLIVKFRQLWNWMSTRWYVLPIIRQQSDVNMQQAIMLMEMAQLQALNARHIADLQEKTNRLEEYIRQQKEQ